MKIPLTQRQHELLQLLRESKSIPTYATLARKMRVSSRATIHKHVAALERKGYLKRFAANGSSNYIALIDEAGKIEAQPLAPISQRTTFTVPESLRWQIWERDGFQCLKCGARSCLTVDHVEPWQQGGAKLDENNLQTLCRPCNSTKRLQTANYRASST